MLKIYMKLPVRGKQSSTERDVCANCLNHKNLSHIIL
jgi:hypothetical protein